MIDDAAGASFIVIAAVVHMLRVVLFGSYKKPREVTWMTGVVLLLIILGFALTGYLLPWDQKAYWATTVTINIARSAPVFGEQMAGLMQRLRCHGPALNAAWSIAHYEDFMLNADRRPSYLGEQDLLSFDLVRREQGQPGPRTARILVRPSGTEPKLKLYVHLQTEWDDTLGYQLQLRRLQGHVAELGQAFFKP